MADLTFIAGKVAPIHAGKFTAYPFLPKDTTSQGVAVLINSNGKVEAASAAAAGTAKFRGITLEKVGKGQAVDVMDEGYLAGFDVSALDYDAKIYLSDTAGKLSDTTGTVEVVVGRVVPMSEYDLTKVIRLTGIAG